MFSPKFKAKAPTGTGIWTPKSQTPTSSLGNLNDLGTTPPPPPPPIKPIWTPQPSPVTGHRKEFRPVRFESPTLPRRYIIEPTPTATSNHATLPTPLPPWSDEQNSSYALPSPRSVNSCTNLSTTTVGSSSYDPYHDAVLLNGHRPSASVSDKIRTFERSASASELNRPFVRRHHEPSRPIYRPNEVIYKVKHEYMSEPESESDLPRKMAQLGRRQYDGIGPVTQDGMPIILRSEVKEPHQHEWYKRLYQTIHKQKNGDDYVIRYKCPRGRYPYKTSGYLSEPEPNYDSDYSTLKYRTQDKRRLQSVSSAANVRDEKLYGTMPNPIKSTQPAYKNQPGRIENYITGHSSVSEKEKKEWWDEVMDIFNGIQWLQEHTAIPRIIIELANDHLDQTKLSPHYTEGNLSRALAKESGYTSDSNLVFRKKELLPSSPLSPIEQRQAYKSLQLGGEPPLLGFRKPAPEKPKETYEEVEYIQISPTLTKIRITTKELEKPKSTTVTAINENSTTLKNSTSPPKAATTAMFTPFPKHVPSFIPLSQNKQQQDKPTTSPAPPVPAPPQRGTAIVRAANDRLVQVRSRHEQCFQSPDSAVSVGNRYGTITLRKHTRHEPICRSKSAGAVPTLLAAFTAKETHAAPNGVHIARLRHHTRVGAVSPTRKQSPRVVSMPLRQSSRSPVAFGRSISRERTFAEEKKRLENVLPRSRNTFEASTNILRDPSLKSPQDVKAAVRSYATCSATHWRSKSVPRLHNPSSGGSDGVAVNTTVRHTMCFPQLHKSQTTPVPRTTSTVSASRKTQLPLRSASAKHVPKNVSTASLARTNSTYSLESTTTHVVTPKQNSTTIEHTTKSKLVTKQPAKPMATKPLLPSKSDSNLRSKFATAVQSKDRKSTQASPQKSSAKRPTTSKSATMPKAAAANAKTPHKVQEIRSTHYFQQSAPERSEKTLSWHECTQSLTTPRLPSRTSHKTTSYYNTRSLSPHRIGAEFTEDCFVYSDDGSDFGETSCIDDLVWQYEQRAKSGNTSDSRRGDTTGRRKFSPTREIRVPQSPVPPNYMPQSLPHPPRKFSPTPEIRVPPNKPNDYIPRPLSPSPDYEECRKFSPTREVRVPLANEPRGHVSQPYDVRDIARPDSPSAPRRFSPTREVRLNPTDSPLKGEHVLRLSRPRSPRDVRDIARPESPTAQRRFSPTREVRLDPSEVTFHYSRPRSPRDVRDIARPDSPTAPRRFSPTREIRIPQSPRTSSPDFLGAAERSDSPSSAQPSRRFSPTREVRIPQTRSPSRRRIESCRSQTRNADTNKVIRASSLSSADEGAQRGLYLCGELAHSATSLAYHDRHSPTCRYRNNSARFTDLNRFYSTLERVGQLERATSETSFKPLRKESELLDFDEWRKVRLYERAEKELHYLVGKLKQEQREKDLLFRPKDVEDVRWRKETDFGLHAKEKSVEDLREDFERKLLLKELDLTRTLDHENEYIRPYWRRNTVADLTSNLEARTEAEQAEQSLRSNERHFSKQLVSTLSKEQILKVTQQLNEIYAQAPAGHGATAAVSEEYVVTVNASKPIQHKTKPVSPLKVRCNSSITKEELLGPVLRKKQAQVHAASTSNKQRAASTKSEPQSQEKPRRSGSPVLLPRETRGALVGKNVEGSKSVSELPASSNKEEPAMDLTLRRKEPPKEHISQKIQYFEERQFDEPPKTIYHAREDSSPDEEEVMRIVEQNIAQRTKEARQERETKSGSSATTTTTTIAMQSQHKELSNSLTDLREIYGERNLARVNFHMHTPPERPPDSGHNNTARRSEQHELDEEEQPLLQLGDMSDAEGDEPYSAYCSSTELYTDPTTFHYRSRSLSPQSQCSSTYLQRVHTGEVQKICQKFESIGHCQDTTTTTRDHFFGLSPLRKARSDSELHSASDSESKDALKTHIAADEHGDVAWMTHKFEVRNKIGNDEVDKATKATSRSSRQPRRAISPVSMKTQNRLMPHIDIISKTVALKSAMKPPASPPPPPPPQLIDNEIAGNVERMRSRYESPPPPPLSAATAMDTTTTTITTQTTTTTLTSPTTTHHHFRSSSNPDLTDIGAHLNADWIAHRHPRPQRAVCKAKRHRRANSASPPRPPKCIRHARTTAVTTALKPYYDDIFANQNFDPKKHQPKARYVPKNDDDDNRNNGNDRKLSAAHATSCAGHCNILKRSVAVTFKDQDYAPPVPPQTYNNRGELPTHGLNGNYRSGLRRGIRMQPCNANSFFSPCSIDIHRHQQPSMEGRIRPNQPHQQQYYDPALEANYNYLTQKANIARDRRLGLQKLHRSCGNLSKDTANSNHLLAPSNADFHQTNLWRDATSNCDIPNCGKILWVSQNGDTCGLPRYFDNDDHFPRRRLQTAAPRTHQTQTTRNSAPVIIRTNAKGLPSTPLPDRRQTYLANQHAVEAGVPLVMSEYRKSKSPSRYFESDVNIHFKTPVRHEYKDPISEDELAVRQAEQMQKLYQEERRRKYLQELQDMNSRRHTDNFTPSQKSPIALNRYDDFPSDLAPKSPNLKPRTVARALYNFQGQTARELSFRKGDVIYLRRQIDKNWYEGEHNAMIGLLPANYIEIINRDAGRPQAKRPSEGQARAKYNFQAQSGVELSLNKGELVTLTRRVDDNWFEGKIANRKGIFPVSYVEVLVDIGADDHEPKTIITHHSTTNLRPSLDVLRTNINNEFNIITQNGQQPPNGILKGVQHKTEALHVDTTTEPLAYRALYKYRPQNSDELELLEGDLVHVLEKCDDGWFVGTSQRTGCFGTFPGNYVERV